MFADYDGHAADAEHQRRQRPRTKVLYVSLHGRHAQFAMPAMCGASAVEITQLLITSHCSIHESKVVVDLGGLSESESVVAMFSIPPLARPRPGVSNSNAASLLPRSSSTNGASNAPRRRSALGPFVHSSNGRTGIRSANHAAGLIGLLQLAGAHPTGLVGTLGHNNRTAWFQDNIQAIFQADGPLIKFPRWF